MSRLLVLTRPSLVSGFRLAGVEAFAAENVEAAQRLLAEWLDAGEAGLLAVDEELLAGFDPAFRRRMEAVEQLPYLALPSGEPAGPGTSRRSQIADLIRKAIGFHITFQGEQAGG